MEGNSIQKSSIFEPVETGGRSSRMNTAVFLLICILPIFSTLVFGAVDSATWVFISIFWALIALLWLAESWSIGGLLLNTSKLQIPLLGLLAIGLIQLLPFGGGEIAGIDTARSLSLDPYATRFFVIRLVIFLTFFAACMAFINSERRLHKVVGLVVIFGAAMAFFGILQRLANPDGIYGMRLTPQAIPFGPLVNQHHFAAFMEMTAGLTLGLTFGRETSRERKIMLVTAFVIMGVAVVFTSSRGGMLGFAAASAFAAMASFVAHRRTHREEAGSHEGGNSGKLILVAAAIAVPVLIFGTVLMLGGNDSLLRGIGIAGPEGDLSTGRLHFWPVAIQIFMAHPIIGAGFDAFGAAFTRYDTWNGLLRVEQAHNDYLQTLADGGIMAFICVAGFIVLLFNRGMSIVSGSHGFRRSSAIGALAGCLGLLVHSFFDFPLRTNSNTFFFLLLAAIATVSVSAEHHHHHHRHHRR